MPPPVDHIMQPVESQAPNRDTTTNHPVEINQTVKPSKIVLKMGAVSQTPKINKIQLNQNQVSSPVSSGSILHSDEDDDDLSHDEDREDDDDASFCHSSQRSSHNCGVAEEDDEEHQEVFIQYDSENQDHDEMEDDDEDEDEDIDDVEDSQSHNNDSDQSNMTPKEPLNDFGIKQIKVKLSFDPNKAQFNDIELPNTV